jgi:hypothetical protein
MDTVTQQSRRAEDLLLGALAALALRGTKVLPVNEVSFHKHFAAALGVFENADEEIQHLATFYHRDPVSRTYDELDHALITAEQHRFVNFPNPTYSRLQINLSRRAAEKLLEEWGDRRAVFEAAADSLAASIES